MATEEASVDVTQGMPGQWVTTPVEELREGDLVRGLDEAGRYGALTPEAAVESIDDEYVYLVGSGGWNIGRTFERWVPAEAQATGRWDSVTLDLLSVGDRVRVTHLRDEDSVQEAVVTHLHCSMERASNPFDTRRAVQLTKDNGMRFCAHSDTWSFEKWVVEATVPAFTWVTAPSTLLAVGDHVRGVGRADTVEGVVERVSEGGYVKLDTSAGNLSPARRWARRTTVTSTPEPAPRHTAELLLARPQVGDHFTRTFNVPSGGNPARREGCVVTSVRDVGDAPGQDLWVIRYRTDVTVYDRDLLVRPDGTCEPNDPAQGREDRDLTGRYEPVVAGPGTWSDVNSLLLSEGDRARWRYDSEDAEWHEVTVTEVDSDGDVYFEGSSDYITGSRNKDWQRWVATPTQADGTPLPDWATSLDAARRHVHAKARELFVSRDNCARGTADFLSAAGLPDHRRDYPAPPDETEQIREFLTLVREAAITTANRHGKTMSLVHTWLRREGITEPAPPPVQYTVTVTAPAGTSREDVINSARQLGRQGWEVS